MTDRDPLTKTDLADALLRSEQRFKTYFTALLMADTALIVGLIELLK